MKLKYLAAILCIASALAAAQQVKGKKYEPDGVYWAASWKDAVYEAGTRNVPIHFVAHKDGDPNGLKMLGEVYTSGNFIKASREWVNVCALAEPGHEVDAVVEGKAVKVCSRLWNIPCDWHVKCHESGFGKFKPALTLVPITVACDQGGNEVERKQGDISGSNVQAMMDKAMKKCPPGDHIPATEWRMAKRQIDDGDAAFEKGEWKKCNDNYTAASKSPRKALQEIGKVALKKLEKKGNDLYTEAKEKLDTDKEEGIKLLKKIADEFKGFPCAKIAGDLAKDMEAKK